MEELSKSTLEESIKFLQDIFPLEEDKRLINDCLRSSLKGNPVNNMENLEYFITKKDSKVIGLIGLYSTPKDQKEALWLGWYGVHPSYRCKGVGTKMLQSIIDEVKRRKTKYLRLYTSTHPNEHDAHKLYEKQGFKKIQENTNDTAYKILIYELKL